MTRPLNSEPSPPSSDTFPAFWNAAGLSPGSAVTTYTAWLGDVGRLQNEIVRFIKARLSEDYQTAAQLAACRNPTEAFNLQFQYAGNAMFEFMAESRKVLELWGQLGLQGVPRSH